MAHITRPLAAHDLPAVRELLQQAGLPHEDLTPAAMGLFLGVRQGDAWVGVVGLEPHGDTGLLRSLVVAPAWQGQGVADQLVRDLQARARALGLARLVLLTQTAEPYFVQRGYAPVLRHTLPLAVQQSAQFRSLCPASAACLTRLL